MTDWLLLWWVIDYTFSFTSFVHSGNQELKMVVVIVIDHLAGYFISYYSISFTIKGKF